MPIINCTYHTSGKEKLEGIRVLLLEDEPDTVELLLFILEDAGAETLIGTSARDAWNLLIQKNPDIILCDIRLPVINGNQFIRRVRSAQNSTISQIPAIAITAYPSDIHEVDSLNAGFDQFLSKFCVGPELTLFCYYGGREDIQILSSCFQVWDWKNLEGIHAIHELM